MAKKAKEPTEYVSVACGLQWDVIPMTLDQAVRTLQHVKMGVTDPVQVYVNGNGRRFAVDWDKVTQLYEYNG